MEKLLIKLGIYFGRKSFWLVSFLSFFLNLRWELEGLQEQWNNSLSENILLCRRRRSISIDTRKLFTSGFVNVYVQYTHFHIRVVS